jgi:hypothetical protein
MRLFHTILFALGIVSLSCSKIDPETDCIKGKLLINGICGNITIQVLSANIDTRLIDTTWTDPSTSITYKNVFALKSICTFPSTLKEGDEFYFRIDNSPKGTDCAVCLAYRPVPTKGLMISVCK